MTENLELREWIAVNLMGWEKRSTPNGAEYFVREGVDVSHEELPHYELTWNDAALVVETMRTRGYRLVLTNANVESRWFAFFGEASMTGSERGRGDDQSAPMAICLAAKAAIEATK